MAKALNGLVVAALAACGGCARQETAVPPMPVVSAPTPGEPSRLKETIPLRHPPKPPPKPSAPPGTSAVGGPEILVGLDPRGVERLLGQPDWSEDVPPARYWRYARNNCTLKVFFFLELSSQSFRVLSYEVAGDVSGPKNGQPCFQQILARNAQPQVTIHGAN